MRCILVVVSILVSVFSSYAVTGDGVVHPVPLFDPVDSLQWSGGAGDDGKVIYDTDHKILTLKTAEGTSFGWGDEAPRWCRNVSGMTMTNGMVVRQAGGTGHNPDVDFAIGTNEATASVYGAVTQGDIANNEWGWVIRNGRAHSLVTGGLTPEGADLYLSTNLVDSSTGYNWTTNRQNNGLTPFIGKLCNAHNTQGVVEFWPQPVVAFCDVYNIVETYTGTNTQGRCSTYLLDGTSTGCELDLLSASLMKGRVFNIKAINIDNDCTVDPYGDEYLDFTNTTYRFGTVMDSITIQSDGTQWWRID